MGSVWEPEDFLKINLHSCHYLYGRCCQVLPLSASDSPQCLSLWSSVSDTGVPELSDPLSLPVHWPVSWGYAALLARRCPSLCWGQQLCEPAATLCLGAVKRQKEQEAWPWCLRLLTAGNFLRAIIQTRSEATGKAFCLPSLLPTFPPSSFLLSFLTYSFPNRNVT